jgi:hypothetical protein
MHDLASANPNEVAELQAQLNQWRKDVGAIMPTVNPDWKEGQKVQRPKRKKRPAQSASVSLDEQVD